MRVCMVRKMKDVASVADVVASVVDVVPSVLCMQPMLDAYIPRPHCM